MKPYYNEPDDECLTVRELIEKLGEFLPDSKVIVQGCDCDANAKDVSFDKESGFVIIERVNP